MLLSVNNVKMCHQFQLSGAAAERQLLVLTMHVARELRLLGVGASLARWAPYQLSMGSGWELGLAYLGLVLHSPALWVIQAATMLLWPCLFGHLGGSFACGLCGGCTKVYHAVLGVAGESGSFQCGPLSVLHYTQITRCLLGSK